MRNDENTRAIAAATGSRIRDVSPVQSAVSGESRSSTQRSHADILDLLIHELHLVPVEAKRG